ncbi:hypothetical protein [Synechococcus sp. RedBA-s]|uniref:hypothetical protein n=1 Tax=Synechococcus sp. RedBA-s TaxID=2823741 RepID=UPI0020CBC2B0|nr:hypothetical protein [Synechococcus sp. RedBA-s]
MSKSTTPYWNPLAKDQSDRWRWLEGLEAQVQELILSEDPATGEITRLTRFLSGADTAAFGGKAPSAATKAAWCSISPSPSEAWEP